MYSASSKYVEEVARHRARFGAIAAVEGRLAAAGLVLREIDPVAEALEHLGHRHADPGEELVDDAGDEQGNAGRHVEKDRL